MLGMNSGAAKHFCNLNSRGRGKCFWWQAILRQCRELTAAGDTNKIME